MDLSQVKDINSVAGLLKMFFRQLPISLIPPTAYHSMITAFQRKDGLSSMRNVVADSLPPAHFYTLRALLKHLKNVASCDSQNRMGVENLARIFLPNLLRNNSPNLLLALAEGQNDHALIRHLIANVDSIFKS